ncbi:hypothetical protein GCM10009069_23790 [Algimonas arctica]|uniref:Uncharacterized protein n=1 Tax=Algimonas arctica TaxID=1479486 RepID=A0A8J3CU42_9PROT|nr:hypothetical protein [Algimonas arctica]GHB00204.1 hypothetical protein GCM10009069_23790 [Algimonas arctica]
MEWEIEKANKAEREAKQTAKDRENAWSNPTRSASSSEVEYDRIIQIMMGAVGLLQMRM